MTVAEGGPVDIWLMPPRISFILLANTPSTGCKDSVTEQYRDGAAPLSEAANYKKWSKILVELY